MKKYRIRKCQILVRQRNVFYCGANAHMAFLDQFSKHMFPISLTEKDCNNMFETHKFIDANGRSHGVGVGYDNRLHYFTAGSMYIGYGGPLTLDHYPRCKGETITASSGSEMAKIQPGDKEREKNLNRYEIVHYGIISWHVSVKMLIVNVKSDDEGNYYDLDGNRQFNCQGIQEDCGKLIDVTYVLDIPDTICPYSFIQEFEGFEYQETYGDENETR